MTVQENAATAGGNTPGRPALAIIAALTVDLEGVRAKYECLLCRTVDGPVYGEDDVKAFTATVRTDHRARCTGEPR